MYLCVLPCLLRETCRRNRWDSIWVYNFLPSLKCSNLVTLVGRREDSEATPACRARKDLVTTDKKEAQPLAQATHLMGCGEGTEQSGGVGRVRPSSFVLRSCVSSSSP